MHALWIFPLHVLSLLCSGYLLFHRLNISNTCLHFVCGTYPPSGYFQYTSSSYVVVLFHHVDIFIPCLYYTLYIYYTLRYLLFHRVAISITCLYHNYVCGTFPPCGYFHHMSLSYVWGTGTSFSTIWLFPLPGTCLYYVYGTYFSTMWIFSSSLPRTTLCRSSLKAAMIPFILSNIMAIFSPLQKHDIERLAYIKGNNLLVNRTCF